MAYFHVTRIENRRSIEEFGLDWNRMSGVPGIVGSRGPEMHAAFLGEEWSIGFFCSMSDTPLDVWEVDTTGLTLEDGPDGWWIVRAPTECDRVRLARSNVPGKSWVFEDCDSEDGLGITGSR